MEINKTLDPNLELNDVASRRRERIVNTIRVVEHLIPDQKEIQQLQDNELHGILQQRLINIEALLSILTVAVAKTIPVYERFDLPEPTTTVELRHTVKTDAPIIVTYETLPQKYGTDFTIENKTLHWINNIDPEIFGTIEIIYYRE